MELFQILHKSIPQKKIVFALFRTHQQKQDISKFLLQTIKQIKKSTQDIRTINSFCIELYDILYYYIMFDKITVAKNILRLFEYLAMPIDTIDWDLRIDSLKKIIKMKV